MKTMIFTLLQWALRKLFSASSEVWHDALRLVRNADLVAEASSADKHDTVDHWLKIDHPGIPDNVRRHLIQAAVLCVRIESL